MKTFIYQSGRIVMVWNEWTWEYVFWEVMSSFVESKEVIIRLNGWFVGFVSRNRGRHWDRKRKGE